MKSHIIAALALTVLTVLANSSEAADGLTHAFVITNPTNSTIQYAIKWSGGNWKTHTLSPGYKMAHTAEFTFDLFVPPASPSVSIRFDYICGDDRVSRKTYRVDTDLVLDSTESKAWQAPQYNFRYSRSGSYLDLYKTQKPSVASPRLVHPILYY